MAMREAMLSGADKRDNQSPFAVTEDEVKQITALTYGSISMIDDAIGEVLKRLRALESQTIQSSFLPLIMATTWATMASC